MKSPLNRFFSLFATVVVTALAIAAPAHAAEGGLLVPSAPKDVPDLRYVDGDGQSHTFAEHKGKVVVLHFWAKWCPPCIEELPLMETALNDLKAEDALVVLPLSLDREAATVQAFYDEAGITTLPIVLDEMGSAMRKLDLNGLPGTIILDRDGKEIARRRGVVDWSSSAVIGVVTDALEDSD